MNVAVGVEERKALNKEFAQAAVNNRMEEDRLWVEACLGGGGGSDNGG